MAGVFLTGITGLVGNAVAQRLLRTDPELRVYALVRDARVARRMLVAMGEPGARVLPVTGDLCRAGLGIHAQTRHMLRRHVRTVIHCAADTSFSRPLAVARAVNTQGTAELLALVDDWDVERFAYVSTAFVAGSRTGMIEETALDDVPGFVNAYERSKHEAETLVRTSALPWLVLRPSTIVCDDARGAVTQLNAVHRALRVCHSGLAALMPGSEDTPVDLVTTAHVAGAVAELSMSRGATGTTYHLCAGVGALRLGELLDLSYAVWSRDRDWRRRGIARPALTDLATYRLFERSVEETGDARLCAITRSLSHFVPQLALPKHFVTTAADTALGYRAQCASEFWPRMVAQLVHRRRGAVQRRAA
ncbi:MAG TPA: SDR family oxidoreductase [Longimicrobiales bacterium]|nr:SDR family oxidoreductase [Longimicrobiales bacterium]